MTPPQVSPVSSSGCTLNSGAPGCAGAPTVAQAMPTVAQAMPMTQQAVNCANSPAVPGCSQYAPTLPYAPAPALPESPSCKHRKKCKRTCAPSCPFSCCGKREKRAEDPKKAAADPNAPDPKATVDPNAPDAKDAKDAKPVDAKAGDDAAKGADAKGGDKVVVDVDKAAADAKKADDKKAKDAKNMADEQNELIKQEAQATAKLQDDANIAAANPAPTNPLGGAGVDPACSSCANPACPPSCSGQVQNNEFN